MKPYKTIYTKSIKTESKKLSIKRSLTEKRDEEIEVVFFDKKNIRWVVSVGRTYRNRFMQFTMSGKAEGSVGQNLDRVVPDNKYQKQLIDFWHTYHLSEIDDKIWKDVLRTIDSVNKETEKTRAVQMTSWDDIDDPKVIALAQHLDMSPEEALNTIENYNENSYSAGGTDYLVCDDNEADQEAYDRLESDIEELGFTYINGWENYVDGEDFFRDIFEEFYRSYCEDIQSERSKGYENRLIEEAYDAGLIDDSDFNTGIEGDPDYNDFIGDTDDLIEQYTEYLVDQIRDYTDEFKSEYGDKQFQDTVIKHNLIDMDGLIQYIIRSDGRGNVLNSYDGKEYSEKVGRDIFYIYET